MTQPLYSGKGVQPDPSPVFLPVHENAERALVGAVLAHNPIFDTVTAIVTDAHFHDPVLARIWRWIAGMLAKNKPASANSLKPNMEAFTKLDPANPEYLSPEEAEDYLIALSAASSIITMPRVAEGNANIVRDYAIRREIMKVCSDALEKVGSATADKDSTELARDLLDRLGRVEATGATSGGKTLALAVQGALRITQEAQLGEVGLPTGILSLDRHIGGLRKSKLYIIAGRPAMGKAQPLDAKVMTPTGWTTMGALKVGDAVASSDGRPSIVLAIHPQGEKQVYRVTFSDGRSTECCAEHLWRVRYRDWNGYRVVSTERLTEMLECARYKNRLSVELVTGDFGHDHQMPIDPYVLGGLLGDGSIGHSCLTLTNGDQEVVDRFTELLPVGADMLNFAPYQHRLRTGRMDSRTCAGGTEGLRFHLKAMGLYGTRSHEKFIPAIYKTANKHVRGELLAGLLDTDGWVEAHGTVRYSTSSRQLAEDVVDLVRSLGGMCSIKEKAPFFTCKGERRQGKPHFICRIRHEDGPSLFRLARKGDLAQRGRNATIRLNIESIVPSRVTQAQCISVSHPDHTYVTDDFIVTHNSILGFQILRHAAGQCYKEGKGVALGISYEMDAEDIAQRYLADLASITIDKQLMQMTPHDDARRMWELETAGEDLARLPMILNDSAPTDIAGLISYVKKIHREHEGGVRVLVVDYLQLMGKSGTGKGEAQREQIVAEISRGMKQISRDLKIPVIALAQLNRSVEQREDKRPKLSDLRESGAMEQDADCVMFLYREAYYLAQEEPKDGSEWEQWKARLDAVQDESDIIVAKLRQGRTGVVKQHFDGAHFVFKEPQTKA